MWRVVSSKADVVEECLIGKPTVSEKQQHFELSTCEDFAKKSYIPTADFQTHEEKHQSIMPKEQACKNLAKKSAADFQTHEEDQQSILPEDHAYTTPLVPSIVTPHESTNVQESKLKRKTASEVQLIELSDEEKEEDMKVEDRKQESENLNSYMWYCENPEGETRGPLPMSILKEWRDTGLFELKYKVWKIGQSSQEAILLSDAIRLLFPE